MAVRTSLVAAVLFLWSCTGLRAVQVAPPTPAPPGLVTGYGVEKIGKDPGSSRRNAHLKAIDDLLSRGPVLVTKTIQDRTTVLNVKSATRTMESTFRLHASQLLQPSFMDSGVEDGFAWVLLGMTDNDIEQGWQDFVKWRTGKIDQARILFESATPGPERLPRLKASFALLDEVGAGDDPSLIYYEVKTALDTEVDRIDQLAKLQKQIRELTDSGRLQSAEQTLDQALRTGLDQPSYETMKGEVFDRRDRSARLISAGDECLAHDEFKEAVDRYNQAQQLDRDNPQIASKLARAEGQRRTVRAENVRTTIGFVGVAATRTIGEYFSYKREKEERKRAEAEAEKARAEEAKKKESRSERGRRGRSDEKAKPVEESKDAVAAEGKPDDRRPIDQEGKLPPDSDSALP